MSNEKLKKILAKFRKYFSPSNELRLIASYANYINVEIQSAIKGAENAHSFLPKYFGIFGLFYIFRFASDIALVVDDFKNLANDEKTANLTFFRKLKLTLLGDNVNDLPVDYRRKRKRFGRLVNDLAFFSLNLACLIVSPPIAIALTIVSVSFDLLLSGTFFTRDMQHLTELEQLRSDCDPLFKLQSALDVKKTELKTLKEKQKQLVEQNQNPTSGDEEIDKLNKHIDELKGDINKKKSDIAALKNQFDGKLKKIEALETEYELAGTASHAVQTRLSGLGTTLLMSAGMVMCLFPPTVVPGLVILSLGLSFMLSKTIEKIWKIATKSKDAAKAEQDNNKPFGTYNHVSNTLSPGNAYRKRPLELASLSPPVSEPKQSQNKTSSPEVTEGALEEKTVGIFACPGSP